VFDGGKIVGAQQTDAPKHSGVRERALNVELRQSNVETDRSRETLDAIRYGLFETTRPEVSRGLVFVLR
jgi:hypothetical protein